MELRAPRLADLGDRRTILAAGAVGLALVAAGAAVAVGSGNFQLLAMVAGLGIMPLLLFAGIRWPYVFPYGLYCLVIPFDQILTIPGAGSLTRYLAVATAVCLAIYAFRTRRVYRPPLAFYFWFVFLAWLLLGVFRSVDARSAVMVQVFVGVILCYAFVVVAPISERQLRFLIAATIGGGVIASLYGLYLFHQDPTLVAANDSRATVSMMGLTLDANMYADSLLAPFAFALVALLRARKAFSLLGTFAALAIISAAILASLSREALLAVSAIVAVTVWFSRRRLLGFAIAIPALGALALIPAVTARIADSLSSGGAGRTSIWKVDWTAFLQHPVFGWGTGNSIEAYDRNYLAVSQLHFAGWAREPHNTVLFIAVELGIIGVVLFLSGWLSAFGPLAAVRRGDPLYDLRVGLTASLVGLLVAGNFVDVSATKFFWLVLAFAAQFRIVLLSRAPVVAPPQVAYEPTPAAARRLRTAEQRLLRGTLPQ